jgi:hypothetical protein
MKIKALLIFPCLLAAHLSYGQLTDTSTDIYTPDYGGPFSIGVSIGGGGLLNIPVRYFFSEKTSLEFSPGFRPVVIFYENGKIDWFGNVSLIGGLTVNFSKIYIPAKNNIRMNGIFLKGGGSIGSEINELIFGAGWSYERFKSFNPNRSFNIELGIGMIRMRDMDYGEPGENVHFANDEEFVFQPAIMWRFAWHFFFPKE